MGQHVPEVELTEYIELYLQIFKLELKEYMKHKEACATARSTATPAESVDYDAIRHQQVPVIAEAMDALNALQQAEESQQDFERMHLEYHPVDTPKSPPSTSTEASSSQRKEPKAAKEKLPPKDKGKKPMKLTIEEVPEESPLPIHLYSGIPEIRITEPMPKNVTTADRRQDGAYKTLAPAATKEQEWTIKAFNTIWNHNITMTVEGALTISQPLQNHFREMVTPKRITNANMATISEIPDDGTDDALPFPGKSPPGMSANHSNTNSLSASVTELEGTVGAVDPVEAFYSHWPPEHHASLCVTKDTDLLRAIMAVIDGKEEVE
ncbi:hypothetical protein C0995_015859, partial [Termitomyces sp. Mi166